MVTPSLATGSGGFLESNYDVTYNPYTNTVAKKTLTVTVNPNQIKEYGASNPATYTYVVSPSLTGLVALNGTLTRVA